MFNYIFAAYAFDHTSSYGSHGSNDKEGKQDNYMLQIGRDRMARINHGV